MSEFSPNDADRLACAVPSFVAELSSLPIPASRMFAAGADLGGEDDGCCGDGARRNRRTWSPLLAARLGLPRAPWSGPAAATHSRHPLVPAERPEPPSPTDCAKRGGAGSFYCGVCKKYFASSATWNVHAASARHLDSVKKGYGQRTPTKGRPKPHSANLTATPPERKSLVEAASSSVVETVFKRRELDGIAAKKPSIAVPVYWNMAKFLWQEGSARETAATLFRLICLLEMISKGETNKVQRVQGPAELTPERVSRTLQFARLALARILAGCSPESTSVACELYLRCIRDWIPDGAVTDETLLNRTRRGPVGELLGVAASVCSEAPLQAEGASIDFCAVLAEYALTCLACPSIADNCLAGGTCESWQESAIACAMAAACATSTSSWRVIKDRSGRYIDLLNCLSLIFERHGEPYQVADCYLLIGQHSLHGSVQPASDDGQCSSAVLERLAHVTWAAVLAIELDDVVRFLQVQDAVSKFSPVAAGTSWHDVNFVIRIGRAKADQDYCSLAALQRVDLPLVRARSMADCHSGLARWMVKREEDESEAPLWVARNVERPARLRTAPECLDAFWKRVAGLLE